eukprot:scaffold17431_cov141-Skeletonema_dohrnii-CCMP3373.AAC.8
MDSAEQKIQSNTSNPSNNAHVNVRLPTKPSVFSVVMLSNVIERRGSIIMRIVRHRWRSMPGLC